MNVMRRLKSNASGRSSVSDPRGDSSVKRVKVEQDVESDVISELQSVEKSTKGVEVKQEHMDVKVTDMVASTSNTSSIVKPEKLDYDELPKEMHEMKIKEDKSEDKEIEATVVNGNGTEKGQIIVTSVGGRNEQPNLILHAKVEHQEPSEVHANQERDVSGVEMQPTSAGQDTSRKIEVPSNKVGVLIGKAGDTVRTLQFNSGARIQITRDADADPNSATRSVEIIGSLENINKAEKLIKDVIAEADVGGSPSLVAKGFSNFQFSTALEQIEIQVPNEKVGFIIGKGGETIKNLQTRSGSRIQVIPQHLPEGDQSKERTVRVTGDKMQIEMAREMIKEAMTQPIRLTASASGYHQQNLRPRGPQSHHTQPNGYDYMQGPPDIYGGQAGHTHAPSGPPAMHARGSGPGPTMGPPPSQANYNYGQLQGPGYGQQPTPYQQTAPQGYHQGPPPSAYPQGTTHPGYMQQDQYSKPPTNNIPQQGPYGQPYGQPQQPPSRNSVGWEQRPPTNMQGPPDIYGGQAGHTHAPSGPPTMHTLGSGPGPGPGPTLGPPPSQANYNYGQLQGPGYGQQPTPYQQTAPQGYHQGPPPSAYPQGTTHPGYMQQDQFSKPPTNTIPQQGPYGQPYGQPNQGPLSSSQSYGPNVPAQQPYPYTSSGPMQQSYPQYPVAPSQGGQSGVPQHAPTANAGYGYTQSGPAASYGQYPATQPGFTEQTPTANTGYGYQGVVADGAYAGGPGTTYGPPSGGQPAAYSQSAPIQPGYGQSIPQSSYHQMYVGHR